MELFQFGKAIAQDFASPQGWANFVQRLKSDMLTVALELGEAIQQLTNQNYN